MSKGTYFLTTLNWENTLVRFWWVDVIINFFCEISLNFFSSSMLSKTGISVLRTSWIWRTGTWYCLAILSLWDVHGVRPYRIWLGLIEPALGGWTPFLRSKEIFLGDLAPIEREYVWFGSLWIFLYRDPRTNHLQWSDHWTDQAASGFLFLYVSDQLNVSYWQFLRTIPVLFDVEHFRVRNFSAKFSSWKFLTVHNFDLKQHLWFLLLSVIRMLLRSSAYHLFVENYRFFQHEFDFEPVPKDSRTVWVLGDRN